MTQIWENSLSEGQLAKLFDYLNNGPEDNLFPSDPTDPKTGVQLEFYERNGFDVGRNPFRYFIPLELQVNTFFKPQYEFHFEIPEGDAIPQEEMRHILLQLRDHIRKKFDMPPLSEDEKASWILDCSPPEFPWTEKGLRRHGSFKGGLTFVRITESEAAKSAGFMKREFPNHVRYFQAWRDKALAQGYNQWSGPEPYIDIIPAWRAMDDSIEAIVGHRLRPGDVATAPLLDEHPSAGSYKLLEKFL
jgi:hypothetical protein